jgi:DcaP outer membrane protein
MRDRRVRFTAHVLTIALMFVSAASNARGQSAAQSALNKSTMEIYGFAMLDFGHDFKTINPAWFDTLRVTRLPSFDKEFGENGNTFAGVRQSRFGVKTDTPTDHGNLKTIFEWELFGVGVDEGQTTIRLRHAYGELGQVGAGQYWSVFTDPDSFPNSLEYWGPTGLVWYRNVQFRWMPIRGNTHVTIGVERPGASGDGGIYRDRIELSNIQPRFPLPDFTGEVTWGGKSGSYLRAAGVVRRISWDDLVPDAIDLSGDVTGWGVNVTSGLKIKKDVIKLAAVYGEGIENHMNDSPVDVGVETNFSDPSKPLIGKALPILGTSAFLDHVWSDRWTTSVGYSRQDIDNTNAQAGNAFHKGQYALVNLLYTPVPNAMVGGELQYGRRQNVDGFQSEGLKLQFSFKYTFGYKLGG